MSKIIKAGPTKAFFVKMLTRDIELADSILDLLDNCVDGVVRELKRQNKPISTAKPYRGFWAHISAKPDHFEIVDNCGGIPQDIAEKSAFMLGRRDSQLDADIATVGMYGIGMKRAMFKMGRHSIVTSQPTSGPYKVEIKPEWLDDEGDDTANGPNPWELKLIPQRDRLDDNGTRIYITDLIPEISHQFDEDKSAFLGDLEKEISRHYALIMEKGFSVKLNGKAIKPVALTLLAPDKIDAKTTPAVEPYVFTGDIGNVHIDLAVGFYRPLATEAELDDEEFVRSKSENAGWTVICNDRVVLYNDKTFKTGWGTKGLTPGYHNQFISIRGIVSFHSKDSMALPLNTTKRGLATDSFIYQAVIDHMRAGLKYFTSFTNRWKKQEEETTAFFKKLSQASLNQIVDRVPAAALTSIRNQQGAKQYVPDMPKPEPQHKQRRVCIAVEQEDIEVVAEYYFDDRGHDRVDVVTRCFDESLKRARRGKA